MSTEVFLLAAMCGALAVVAAVADRMPVPANRYQPLEDHADLGCGADEYRGPRRFTRPTDRGRISDAPPDTRKAPTRSTVKHTRVEAISATSSPAKENR